MQHWAQLAATGAALVAVLLGLARHWAFWAVVERALAAYLVVFGIVGGLLILGRIALRAEPEPSPGAPGNDRNRSRTDGTDAAV